MKTKENIMFNKTIYNETKKTESLIQTKQER